MTKTHTNLLFKALVTSRQFGLTKDKIYTGQLVVENDRSTVLITDDWGEWSTFRPDCFEEVDRNLLAKGSHGNDD